MKDIVIIGAGGVGKETALLIEQINEIEPTWNLHGFIDDNIHLHGSYINGYKVHGGLSIIEEFGEVYVICAIANFQIKKRIVEKLKTAKVKFANIIHPSIKISPTNSIGEGVIIYPGVIMTTNIKIGNHVILSPGCGIGHECQIGDYNSILWNVNLSGKVTLGIGCIIGTSSSILQGVIIGKETIIGAGAVVLKDLPERVTAVGVPAKVIKFNS